MKRTNHYLSEGIAQIVSVVRIEVQTLVVRQVEGRLCPTWNFSFDGGQTLGEKLDILKLLWVQYSVRSLKG